VEVRKQRQEDIKIWLNSSDFVQQNIWPWTPKRGFDEEI